ncbi:MAG: DUF2905 domain-containing protein [Candidatus Omnitrophica bacterium]|nr:DUF2905 domain-containing protein [Candidatus Omnitrophota bacterium]
MDLPSVGKTLIFFGVILVFVGVFLIFFNKIPYLGKLPGHILIQRKNFTFYFPLVTSIILSIVVSVVLYLFRKH